MGVMVFWVGYFIDDFDVIGIICNDWYLFGESLY